MKVNYRPLEIEKALLGIPSRALSLYFVLTTVHCPQSTIHK